MVTDGLTDKVSVAFGRILLWKVAEQYLDVKAVHLILALITYRVMSAFRDFDMRNWPQVNVVPVKRVYIDMSRVDAKLLVFKGFNKDNACPRKGDSDAHDARQKQGVANAEFRFVTFEIAYLHRENSLHEELKRRNICHFLEIAMVCKAVQCLANQPDWRVVPPLGTETSGAAAVASGPPAKLYNLPKFLYEL